MNHKFLVLVTCWGAACGLSTLADAAVDIRIDLNEANSSPGGNWNVLADPSDTEPVLSLIDYNTGLDSGITLQVTDDFLKSSGYFPAMDAWANPAFPWVDVVALRDYAALVADNTTGQLEFAGLDPEKSYVVEILGIRDNVADYIGQCTVNGAYDDDNDSSSWNCYADGWVNTDGMVWENVSPDANGKIIVDATMTNLVFFMNACRLSEGGEESLEGDLNGDGFVGGDDLDIVRSFWGQTVTLGDLLSGDPSKDGFVGGDDLDIVRANWGQGTPPTPTSVPEPSTILVLLTGSIVLMRLGRMKRCE